jgi:hypothetical protein
MSTDSQDTVQPHSTANPIGEPQIKVYYRYTPSQDPARIDILFGVAAHRQEYFVRCQDLENAYELSLDTVSFEDYLAALRSPPNRYLPLTFRKICQNARTGLTTIEPIDDQDLRFLSFDYLRRALLDLLATPLDSLLPRGPAFPPEAP